MKTPGSECKPRPDHQPEGTDLKNYSHNMVRQNLSFKNQERQSGNGHQEYHNRYNLRNPGFIHIDFAFISSVRIEPLHGSGLLLLHIREL